MDNDQFRLLLTRPESDTLDFKMTAYELSTAGGRNSFTIDLLALANTPRQGPARIILGVSWTPEGGSVVTGLDCQLDDAVFQDAIAEGRITPRPNFRVIPFQYEGKQVGIVEVEPEHTGPYTPIKDYPSPTGVDCRCRLLPVRVAKSPRSRTAPSHNSAMVRGL